MTNTELLNGAINKSGLKKKKIAEMMGITVYSLIKKRNNTTEFKASEIEKLSEILKLTDSTEKERIFFAK